MKWVAAVGGGAFVLASLVVSVRLLLLARHTRGLPELLIGLGLLLMGGIGYPLSTTARLLDDPAWLKTALFAVHAVLSLVGQACVALFNWRVFHPGETWAKTLCVGLVASLAALLLWQTATPGWGELARTNAGPWSWLPLYSLSVLGWAGLASLDYSRKLARRLQLGLADAVTADRVRLWATAMLAAFAVSAISLALRALGVPMTAAVTGVVVGPLGLVSAAAMWLAFLPPRRYLRWVEARGVSAAPSAG